VEGELIDFVSQLGCAENMSIRTVSAVSENGAFEAISGASMGFFDIFQIKEVSDVGILRINSYDFFSSRLG
jgi:hypothetical protein